MSALQPLQLYDNALSFATGDEEQDGFRLGGRVAMGRSCVEVAELNCGKDRRLEAAA
jgi:hypothetical protein